MDNGNTNPLCGGLYSMATLPKASFYCKPRQTGRYLNIRLVGNSMILTLCEVEVYSESRGVIHLNLEFRFPFFFYFRLTMTFELSILEQSPSMHTLYKNFKPEVNIWLFSGPGFSKQELGNLLLITFKCRFISASKRFGIPANLFYETIYSTRL